MSSRGSSLGRALWRWTCRCSLLIGLGALACAEEQPTAPVVPWIVPAAGETVSRSTLIVMLDGGFDRSLDGAAQPDEATDGALAGATEPDWFDPDEVYLFDPHAAGRCSSVIHALTGPSRSLQLHCDGRQDSVDLPQIRPLDGRILYGASTGELVELYAEGPTSTSEREGARPPEPTLVRFAAPECAATSTFRPRFKLSADGVPLFACERAWVDREGQQVAALTPHVLAFGRGQTALRTDGVLRLWNGVLKPVAPLAKAGAIAARTRADGFWIVVRDEVEEGQLARWHVAFDGTAEREGVYPPLPSGVSIARAATPDAQTAIDGRGRIVQLASRSKGPHQVLVMRSLEGESQLLLDALQPPLRPTDHTFLVTGP